MSEILNLVSETTYNTKTATTEQLLTEIAKKVGGIAEDSFIVDSENTVQSKVIQAALNEKVDKVSGKGLVSNDFSDNYKNKIDNATSTVAEGNNNIITSGGAYNAIESVKVLPNLTLNKSSVSTLKNGTATVTATRSGNGAITATSSNTSYATVSVSGTTITVTGGSSSGTSTITVTCAASGVYKQQIKTFSVTNTVASSTLSENTPATIKAVAQTGQAANLWSVGDKTKAITLNGTVGALILSNDYYYAFILGFNHNSSREGSNSIHFMLGKTLSGTNITFCDSRYERDGSGAMFHMNSSNTNSGGWSSSYMRSTICPAFKSAMPSAWQNVISACTKYTDNTGGGSNIPSYVTSTTDYIFLLSEYEVQGARRYANSNEKNYQQQYAYFANGNSKVFYKHDATSTVCNWWLRSVSAMTGDTEDFCVVPMDGSESLGSAIYSRGFAPCFKVA